MTTIIEKNILMTKGKNSLEIILSPHQIDTLKRNWKMGCTIK